PTRRSSDLLRPPTAGPPGLPSLHPPRRLPQPRRRGRARGGQVPADHAPLRRPQALDDAAGDRRRRDRRAARPGDRGDRPDRRPRGLRPQDEPSPAPGTVHGPVPPPSTGLRRRRDRCARPTRPGRTVRRGARARLCDLVAAAPTMLLLRRPALATVLSRPRPPGCDDDETDALVRPVRDALFAEGHSLVASTVVDGRPCLKLTVLDPDLHTSD